MSGKARHFVGPRALSVCAKVLGLRPMGLFARRVSMITFPETLKTKEPVTIVYFLIKLCRGQ
jgi:hypothetical protein